MSILNIGSLNMWKEPWHMQILTTKMFYLLNILPTDAGIGSHDTDHIVDARMCHLFKLMVMICHNWCPFNVHSDFDGAM